MTIICESHNWRGFSALAGRARAPSGRLPIKAISETTIVSTAVTETMGPIAGNLAGAVDSAYQIMTSSTSPAAQNAESQGQIPDDPTDMPDTYTLDESAPEDSTDSGYTVTIESKSGRMDDERPSKTFFRLTTGLPCLMVLPTDYPDAATAAG